MSDLMKARLNVPCCEYGYALHSRLQDVKQGRTIGRPGCQPVTLVD